MESREVLSIEHTGTDRVHKSSGAEYSIGVIIIINDKIESATIIVNGLLNTNNSNGKGGSLGKGSHIPNHNLSISNLTPDLISGVTFYIRP